MTVKTDSLAAALALFQSELPKVGKSAAGQVPGRKDYKYADLADTNSVILPALGRLGLSFSAKPTLNDDGVFVLAYVLRHAPSGEFDKGEWKLPQDATPQQMGSAITYARRYALQAVTGVAPDEDDDGQAASQQSYTAPRRQVAPPQQRQATPERTPTDSVVEARKRLAAIIAENNWSRDLIASRYKMETGHDLGAAVDATVVEKFTNDLFAHSDHELGRNGAPA